MEPDSAPEEGNGRRWWIIIFCLSLLILSIFWSVDRSIIYFSLAIAAFSLFKILQFGRSNQSAQFNQRSYTSQQQAYGDNPYQHKPSESQIFWEELKVELKEGFRKSGSTPTGRGKIFIVLVAGFIGFMFFIAILGAIFGGNATDDLVYHYQATEYFNNKQYDSAALYYKLAIRNDPENAELYFECGNAFLNAEKADSALSMYDQALVRNPQHSRARYNKGIVYYNRRSYNDVIRETKQIVAYDPNYDDAKLLMGDSFYNQSQLDSALRWYEDAYDNGVRSAVLCHFMAYIYDMKGQTNTAIGLYREAIEQDSTIKAIYVRLGEIVPGEEGNWYRQKASQME